MGQASSMLLWAAHPLLKDQWISSVAFYMCKIAYFILLPSVGIACVVRDSPWSCISPAAVPFISVCSALCNRKTVEILFANGSAAATAFACAGPSIWSVWGNWSWLRSEAALAASMACWPQQFCLQGCVYKCMHCCAPLVGRGMGARPSAFGRMSGLPDNRSCFFICLYFPRSLSHSLASWDGQNMLTKLSVLWSFGLWILAQRILACLKTQFCSQHLFKHWRDLSLESWGTTGFKA